MQEIRAAAIGMLQMLEGQSFKPTDIVFAAGAAAWLEAVKVTQNRDFGDTDVPDYDLNRRYFLSGFPLVLDPLMALDKLTVVANGRGVVDVMVHVTTGTLAAGKRIVEVADDSSAV